MSNNLLSKIPSVSDLLSREPLRQLTDRVSHHVVVTGVRSFLDDMRRELNERTDVHIPPVSEIAERIARRILIGDQPALRPAVNATGVLLHTGLGRATLAATAVEALVEAARDYVSVELDLSSGARTQRIVAVENLLRERTGGEAAAVVNNNAGATVLTLAAIAAGREVIVSRGQLVEIGGSYRLPDVMQVSGARLREVGTTNKTHLSDYERAIGEPTAAILRVHPSNYRIVGFTATPSLKELVELSRAHDLPLIDDIGSGALIDFARFGGHDEPTAPGSIDAGASLVLFSGDKLLGGPQCGIIVGRRDLIERIHAHPLARALRVDKLTLAALAATLRLYRDEAQAIRDVPLLQLLATPIENLRDRAQRLAPQIAALPAVAQAEAVETEAFLGGGSIPSQSISSWCVSIQPAGMSLDQLARKLRSNAPAIVARVSDERLLLDLRTVFPRHDQTLLAALERITP